MGGDKQVQHSITRQDRVIPASTWVSQQHNQDTTTRRLKLRSRVTVDAGRNKYQRTTKAVLKLAENSTNGELVYNSGE